MIGPVGRLIYPSVCLRYDTSFSLRLGLQSACLSRHPASMSRLHVLLSWTPVVLLFRCVPADLLCLSFPPTFSPFPRYRRWVPHTGGGDLLPFLSPVSFLIVLTPFDIYPAFLRVITIKYQFPLSTFWLPHSAPLCASGLVMPRRGFTLLLVGQLPLTLSSGSPSHKPGPALYPSDHGT